MIRIDANRDGTVRVDGWLAPPQRREIEMKTTADPLSVSSDEQGRFAFARVPRGTAQLVVRRAEPGPDGAGRSVVTPALISDGPGGARRCPRRSPLRPRWPARRAGPAQARERGLQEGNAGRPAVGARYIRAGLRQLGWAEDGEQPDARQMPRRTTPWPPGC